MIDERIWLRRVAALLALLAGMSLILAGLVVTASALPPDGDTAVPQLADFSISIPVPALTAAPPPTMAGSSVSALQAGAVESDRIAQVTNSSDRDSEPAEAQKSPSAQEPAPVQTSPEAPLRIIIPAIKLDAAIKPVELIVSRDGRTAEWGVPSGRIAGWHNDTARLGEPGNLVLNGHHNIRGRVFARVKDLKPLDQIILIGERRKVTYEITERMLLLERGQPMSVRLENAQWILPTEDTRLTLVTCWPPNDNSHRLIVVARPVAEELLEPETGKD